MCNQSYKVATNWELYLATKIKERFTALWRGNKSSYIASVSFIQIKLILFYVINWDLKNWKIKEVLLSQVFLAFHTLVQVAIALF